MKRLLLWAVFTSIVIIVIIASIILFNTGLAKRSAPDITLTVSKEISLDEEKISHNLSKAIQIKTISHQDKEKTNWEEFNKFIRFLEDTFPNAHSTLKREIINSYALLFTWEGKQPAISPTLLIAHYDVVPAEESTEHLWKYPPFSGAIAEGFVWGRGTLDVKCNVIGIMEAVEFLIKQGFTPKRTILISFGHDEEVGGRDGALAVATTLKSRGIIPEFSLDEGMAITKGIIPGIATPVALIGIAEKGYLSLELSVTTSGGHSSNPPRETTIGTLAKAILAIERNPMPAKVAGPIRIMLEKLAPYMDFEMRLVCSNLWLFSPFLKYAFENIPSANAGIRTTFAPTLFHAGEKENVLPSHASAVVNVRMLPGDSKDKVIAYIKDIIKDPMVKIKEYSPEKTDEASPISDINSEGYEIISQTIKQVWGDIPIAPSLTLGGTDSANYKDTVRHLYRFQPLKFTQEELNLIHNINERIEIKNYLKAIEFYIRLIERL
ncbi:MAG: M20 family peptidase [Candidatus Hydrogenedentes bacterium]|nr:M20 family peptidase [Candidatus Hydrogenedentota bacterium]